jgi:L-ribulokinase
MENKNSNAPHVIGLDFGSDSVRALIVKADSGEEIASAVSDYPRWAQGQYCQPALSQFRHHPKDYLESMTQAIRGAIDRIERDVKQSVVQSIVGIGVDSTGSTPAPVDAQGQVLALLPAFADNPNAMFILWKDHTAVSMAERINQLAHSRQFPDYTRYVGGVYSSEWFWAKAAWIAEQDEAIARAVYCWVELCDWIPAILAGNQHPQVFKRSVCAAGHKCMWHPSWQGLPPQDFLTAISPSLDGMRERMAEPVYTADHVAGYLTREWAEQLGLPAGIAIAIGAFDCHMGAVGAGAAEYDLVKVIGTSTCDILMVPPERVADQTIEGICGQVQGSALPNLTALEAGQSAFGDIYAWYKRLLLWPLQTYLEQTPAASDDFSSDLFPNIAAIIENLIPRLSEAAASLEPREDSALAIDWLNGRRTPYANQRLKGVIGGLNLGSTAVELFAALVESTAHGAKAIVDCFLEQGIEVRRCIAIGGIAQKSPYVMQTCANVIDRDIAVVRSEQCCALGAAIFAAVAAGVYANTAEAQAQMASPVCRVYQPEAKSREMVHKRYTLYRRMGQMAEQYCESQVGAGGTDEN